MDGIRHRHSRVGRDRFAARRAVSGTHGAWAPAAIAKRVGGRRRGRARTGAPSLPAAVRAARSRLAVRTHASACDHVVRAERRVCCGRPRRDRGRHTALRSFGPTLDRSRQRGRLRTPARRDRTGQRSRCARDVVRCAVRRELACAARGGRGTRRRRRQRGGGDVAARDTRAPSRSSVAQRGNHLACAFARRRAARHPAAPCRRRGGSTNLRRTHARTARRRP
jgi:hypothetical protein